MFTFKFNCILTDGVIIRVEIVAGGRPAAERYVKTLLGDKLLKIG